MSRVRLIPLGVGEAFSAMNYTTCMALGCDDDWILIDCPHPIRKILREGSDLAAIPLDLTNIRAVVLSHLHADHCSGLEDYAFHSHFALGRKAVVLAHPTVSARLWSNVLSGGMDRLGPDQSKSFADYFDLIDLDSSIPTTFGPFAIECRPTMHSIPTTAFKIAAAGRTLGFSADSKFDPTLIDWLAPADLILHESTTLDNSPVHTSYRRLAALPEPLRRKMRLFHYADDFDLAASLIEPLRQGVSLCV